MALVSDGNFGVVNTIVLTFEVVPRVEAATSDVDVGELQQLQGLPVEPLLQRERNGAEGVGGLKKEKWKSDVDEGAAVVGVEAVGFKRREDEEEVETLWNDWVVGATKDES
ncbi:hypothetical protein TB2_034045 [Malus domestica]